MDSAPVPIPFAPDYAVARDGTVYSLKRGVPRPLRNIDNGTGHKTVGLWHGGVCRRVLVHRLVALVFHGSPPTAAHEVRHLNGVPADNRADNLAWGTRAQNIADRVVHGVAAIGERHGMARLTAAQAAEIRRRARGGETDRALAHEFGVTPNNVALIRRGRTWAERPATEESHGDAE